MVKQEDVPDQMDFNCLVFASSIAISIQQFRTQFAQYLRNVSDR